MALLYLRHLTTKNNGRDLLTLRNRHWYALMERFQTRPVGRVFCAIHDFKITSFVADSSRSYANWFVVCFLVGVFLADATDSTTDARPVQVRVLQTPVLPTTRVKCGGTLKKFCEQPGGAATVT